MTARCTIFAFVDHGIEQSVYFDEDCVADYSVTVGMPVRVIPSNQTYSFMIGNAPNDEGVRCRIMAIENRIVDIPRAGSRERHDATIVHLAIETDSASLH